MERVEAGNNGNNGLILGTTVRGIRHQAGPAMFVVDNTLSPSFHKAEFKGEIKPGAPATAPVPTVSVLDANANSRWEASDLKGDTAIIQYKVQAINDNGHAEASAACAVIADLDAGDSVRVSFATRADAKSYRILRNTAARPNAFFEIAELKNDAPSLSYDDHNWFIPGGRWAIGVEMLNPKSAENRLSAAPYDNAIRAAVLRELTTKRMATIGDFEWEIILERLCPEVPQPLRLHVFYNINPAA
jgi:hypothetical protein